MHTKGPWEIRDTIDEWVESKEGPFIEILGGGKTVTVCEIGMIYSPDGDMLIQETWQNADIIAAALETAAERDRLKAANADLLAACEESERVLKFAFEEGALPEDMVMGLCIDPYGVLADLRAAIAKAKGGNHAPD